MAVDFNPQIQELGNRDWSGSSRGTGPDRSFEALFSGLADTANNLVTNRDAETQAQIRQDAQEGFEQVNTDFGFDPPPPGMQSDMDRMTALQAAMEQGKISQVNYYGRLATLSKQMRSKYPRYENIVDATIQSVTGTRPANAYRDALLAELDSVRSSASDSAKRRESWERQNEGIITAVFGEEYWANPSAYELSDVQSKVGSWKAESEIISADKARLEHQAKLGEVNTQAAAKNFDRAATFAVTSVLDRVNNGQGFQSSIQEFIRGGGADIDGMMTQFATVKTQIRSELQMMADKEYVAKGLMTREEANKGIDAAMANLNAIEEQLGLGNIEFATRMTSINNDVAERSLQEIYRQVPEARIGAGLSKLNPYSGATWMELGGEQSVNAKIKNIALDLVGTAAGKAQGAPSVSEKVLQAGDQKVSREYITKSFNVMTDPNVTPEHMSNLVEEMFGTSGPDFMSDKTVASEDLQQIYTKFLDPSVTKAIQEKGTPEDFAKYSRWAIEKFRALPNVKAIAGDINTGLGDLNPDDIDISYNPGSNRIEFRVTNPGALGGGMFSSGLPNPFSFGSEYRRALPAFIGEFNKAIQVLDPIAKANGSSMEEVIPGLFEQMNRLQEGGSKEGFFGMMLRKFNETDLMKPLGEKTGADALRPTNESSSLQGAQGLVQPASFMISGIEQDDTDLDFIINQERERYANVTASSYDDEQTRNLLDMIGQAEGAGYNTLYGYSQNRYGVVPTQMTLNEVQDLQKRMSKDLGSSAFGKYQIMGYTLRDAMKAMNLSGDEVFTPELQDRIAVEYLLKRRGYDKFRNGEMSASAFLKGLANEWASIPTGRGGRSAYHGDRMNNKASRGGQQIAALFG